MNAKAVTVMAVLMILIGAGGFYLGQTYKLVPANTTIPALQVTPTLPAVVTTSPNNNSVTSTPVPTQIVDDNAAVIAAVKASEVARVGQDANASTYTVTQIQGIYAKGTAGSSGGGAQWFAAKVGGVWKLVFIGNGTVQCSDLTNYPDFPKAWIPDCWDTATQKEVTR